MVRYNTNGSSALAPNDPYNDMEGAEIRPNLQVLDGGRTTPSNNKSGRNNLKVINGGKSNNSKDLLRDSENSALSGNSPTFGSPWKNSVTGLRNRNQGKGKGSFFKQKKGLAAMIVSLCLLAGGGAFLGSSHLLLGPAMSSILTSKSDYRYTATYSQWTNNKFMKAIMNKARGTNNKPMDLSDDFIENLKTYGINTQNNGNNYTFEYKGKTITGDSFSSVFNDDVEFRTAFTNAKQGRAANFFDPTATTTYKHLNISRNELRNLQRDTGDIKVDTDNYNNLQSQKFNNQSVEITTTRAEETQREILDENGDPIPDSSGKPQTTTVVENERNDPAVSDTSTNTDVEIAKTKASSFISKIGTVTNALNWGCTIMRTGNMVIKTASAMERLTSILYAMSFMESISKMMAGDGDQSGYNVLMNFLVSPATTAIIDYSKVSASANYSSSDAPGDLSISIGESTVTGPPLQSNLTNILSYMPLNQELAKNFSFGSLRSVFMGALGFTTMKAAGCAITNIGESVASLAINFLPGGRGIKIVGGTIVKSIFVGIATFSVGSLLGFMLPQIAKLYLNDYLTTFGIPAGEKTVRGIMAANGKIAQSGGNGFGTQEEAAEYARATNQVLAMEAESDRLNRSPFDITSKNTFLGSIAYNLLATTLASNGYSAINSLINTTSRSLASLTNGVYAEGANVNDGTDVSNINNDCGFSNLLKDANGNGPTVAGTAWCTTMPVTNQAVLDMDPTSSDFIDSINDELDCTNGSCTIKSDSDLAKYTSYCDYRDTDPDEIPDARILSELHHVPTLLSTTSAFFPMTSDVVNIIDGFDDLGNVDWGTGKICFTHPKKDIYKAYAIQESIYEQTMSDNSGSGVAYVSPITNYIEQYNIEHPINNTTDLIAHYAGLTTDDAEFIIALVDYYDFLNEYEPDTRIAINENTSKQLTGEEYIAKLNNQEQKLELKESKTIDTPIIAMSQHVIYADIRNRSYAAWLK